MQLEKILEEIDQKIAKVRSIPISEDEFAADGEEIYYNGKTQGRYEELIWCRNIILKHMNDGWIPVEKRLPEDDIPTPKLVTALVPDRKARWDNSETFSVIVDTDVYDPDYTGKWECYKKNVIAWRPLPEPYRLTQKGARENE